ncbi:Putative Lipoprotein (VmcF) [Mycoplasma leachii 99/014/6]|uniref:lipoprotein n=1 Tax=Mycoplasma leachii TaxID=2105 RepID=UPI0002177112|nr:lipoprotein [Mycoplasma leachii]CBV67335.1 Putative Lipoprotein (VmcF) [Mycoplasma leachii 99/014/6]
MKKLLTLLGSVGLIASTSAAVVACGDRSNAEMNNNGTSEKPSEMSKEDKKEEMGAETTPKPGAGAETTPKPGAGAETTPKPGAGADK